MTSAGTKRCVRCGQVKSIDEFWAHPQKRDGLQSYCKACITKCSSGWVLREKKIRHLKRELREKHDEEQARQFEELVLRGEHRTEIYQEMGKK